MSGAEDNYTLHLGEYDPKSSAGDGFRKFRLNVADQVGMAFSTRDRENVEFRSWNCARFHRG